MGELKTMAPYLEARPDLAEFGRTIVCEARDYTMSEYAAAFAGRMQDALGKQIASLLLSVEPSQAEIIRKGIASAIDTALHDFLFRLYESDEFDVVRVNSETGAQTFLKSCSDGFQGDLFLFIEEFSLIPTEVLD